MDRSRGPGTDPSTVAGKAESNIGGGGGAEPTSLRWRSPIAPDGDIVPQRSLFYSANRYFPLAEDENRIYRVTGETDYYIETGIKGDGGEIVETNHYLADGITGLAGTVATESPGLAAEGGVAYIAAGQGENNPTGSVYEYDTSTDTLSHLGEIDVSTDNYTYYTGTIINDGILYIMNNYQAPVKGFDVNTGSEVSVPDAPVGMGSIMPVKVGDSFYANAGDNSNGEMMRYDFASDSWTTLSAMGDVVPQGEYNPGEAPMVYDGEDTIYVCGGYSFTDRFFSYSISEDTWDTFEVYDLNVDQDYFNYGPTFGRHFKRDGSDVLEFWGGVSGFTRPTIPAEVILE